MIFRYFKIFRMGKPMCPPIFYAETKVRNIDIVKAITFCLLMCYIRKELCDTFRRRLMKQTKNTSERIPAAFDTPCAGTVMKQTAKGFNFYFLPEINNEIDSFVEGFLKDISEKIPEKFNHRMSLIFELPDKKRNN